MIDAAEVTTEILPDTSVIVGKDVLELLSSSMYVNPLVIYREYVQNAADAIDDAVAAGLLPSIADGRVDIGVDHIDRRVIIRDNGVGVANADFALRMLSFGASSKRGTGARGFRGVGRLAGLGYAQKIVFRSRTLGDPHVMEVTWDMRTVKRMLASTASDTELQTVVAEAVTFMQVDKSDSPQHFFEVELVKPRRIGNDRLLNETDIGFYISQVCPCPMLPKFKHGSKIDKMLAQHARCGRAYKIHVNDSPDPVYRPYRDEIVYSDTKKGRTSKDIREIAIPKSHGDGLAAIGWFVHHDYHGAIPVSAGVRGLRARIGNIQIGNERLLAEIFPEERFCSWAVGEVHILDDRVVPNGRRDAFESGFHVDHLIVHLRPIGVEIARECRQASQKRHQRRSIELGIDKAYEKLEIIKQGAVSTSFVRASVDDIRNLLVEMRAAANHELFDETESRLLRKQFSGIETATGNAAERKEEDILAVVPLNKREIYREIFDLIYTCSFNQLAAKNTIDRMLEHLSRSSGSNISAVSIRSRGDG